MMGRGHLFGAILQVGITIVYGWRSFHFLDIISDNLEVAMVAR
jgi:hypothetical protein